MRKQKQAAQPAPQPNIYDNLAFSPVEIKPAKIKISHATSDAFKAGKVKNGVVFIDTTNEVLCEKGGSFQFIPFWFEKQLVVKTYKGNTIDKALGMTKSMAYQVVPCVDDPNNPNFNRNQINWKGTFDPHNDVTKYISEQIVFYVLPYKKGMSPQDQHQPCQLIMGSSNLTSARSLVRAMHLTITQGRAKSPELSNPYHKVYDLPLIEKQSEKGSFLCFGDARVAGETDPAIMGLFDRMSQDVVKLLQTNKIARQADEANLIGQPVDVTPNPKSNAPLPAINAAQPQVANNPVPKAAQTQNGMGTMNQEQDLSQAKNPQTGTIQGEDGSNVVDSEGGDADGSGKDFFI